MTRVVMVTATLFLLLAIPALASYDPIGMNRELMQEFSGKSQTAEKALRDKDAAEWTQGEIDDYLYCTGLAVYYALNTYVLENDEHPSSPRQLIDSGMLPVWPANPFNNWEPITWKPGSLEFAPGDLCVQLCPPDWYSRPNPPRPITYMISIFGPTADYIPLHEQESSPFETLTWAVKPSGAVFSHGFMRGAATQQ
jgi:hypothetical protein